MKKFAIWITLWCFLAMTTLSGCAYEKAYQAYATAQSHIVWCARQDDSGR